MDSFFLQAFSEVFDFSTLILIVVGTIFGIVAGAIPGFTITMGVLLAFPFTFAMGPVDGLATMTAILVGGYSGGLISGVMIGIPGTPSSITTTYDGYPMNKNGEAGRALGIGVIASFIGTIISVGILVIFGPLVAKFSLGFGPWEITAIIIFALTMVASLSEGALLKGLIAGAIGLLIATIGVDINGQLRFDFGVSAFSNGFSTLAVMIGAFAFSLLMENVQKLNENRETQERLSKVNTKIKIPYKQILKDMWANKWNALRSSAIGSLIGALPATGGDVANFVSYDQAKKFSKHPEKFGKGIPDGIVAAEASNSSTVGGAFIPTLTLGIPGDMVQAIMLGVLILHGITPGPRLFQDQPVLVGSIYVTLLVSALVLLVAQLFLIRFFASIAKVPQAVLVPVVLMLCVVGSFALNNNFFDVWTLFGFGILGFFLAKAGVPLSPMILGLILGETLETELFRALQLDSNWMTFFTRPLSALFFVIALGSILFSIWQSKKMKKRLKNG